MFEFLYFFSIGSKSTQKLENCLDISPIHFIRLHCNVDFPLQNPFCLCFFPIHSYDILSFRVKRFGKPNRKSQKLKQTNKKPQPSDSATILNEKIFYTKKYHSQGLNLKFIYCTSVYRFVPSFGNKLYFFAVYLCEDACMIVFKASHIY